MGGGTIGSHQAKVHGRSQEGQHQRAHRERNEVVAQHHAVEQCINKEHAAGCAYRHVLHAGAQHEHQCQLCNGEQQVQGVDHIQQGCGGRDERGGKGHQQTAGHPAVGAGHIVRRSHGGLCITAIIIVVIHVEVPPFLFRRGCGCLAALAPVYGI